MTTREEIIERLEEIKDVKTPREFAKVWFMGQFNVLEKTIRSEERKGQCALWLLRMLFYGADKVREYNEACETGKIDHQIQSLLDGWLSDIVFSFKNTSNGQKNKGRKSKKAILVADIETLGEILNNQYDEV